MGWGEPPEWQGRGAAGRRDGWPTHGRNGPPRSHRFRDPGEEWEDTIDRVYAPGPPPEVREPPPAAPRPAPRVPPPEPAPTMPVVFDPVVHVFERDRRRSVLEVVRDVAVVLAVAGWLFLVGATIAHGGVPMWVR